MRPRKKDPPICPHCERPFSSRQARDNHMRRNVCGHVPEMAPEAEKPPYRPRLVMGGATVWVRS